MAGLGASVCRTAPVQLRGLRGTSAGDWAGAVASQTIEQIEGGHPLPPHLRNAVIALGNFDGFHVGHQAVVDRARKMAHDRGVATIVGTFDPHPVRHFKSDARHFGLTTLDQRRRLLGAAGVDAMMVFNFDGALASATPEAFVGRWLAGAGAIVTGADFAFGRGRGGDVQTLASLGAGQGMACATVRPVEIDGQVVSSTRIRNALALGDCAAAAGLLTRPFMIQGPLQPIGRESTSGLLRATVDLGLYLRPRTGRYEAKVRLQGGQTLRATAMLDDPSSSRLDIRIDNCRIGWAGLCQSSVEVELSSYMADACRQAA